MKRIVGIARKAGWNLADQILSALSNVVLAILIARSVDAAGFGAFSMAFVVFGIGMAVSRSVVGQPFQMLYSTMSGERHEDAIRRAHGFAALIGVAFGLGSAAVGLVVGGTMGAAFLALAVCFPALLVQDAQRLTFVATNRHWGAVVIDGIWALLAFGLLGVLIAVGRTVVWEMMLTWGASALVAAVVGAFLLRAGPYLHRGLQWLRDAKSLVGYLMAEYILGLGATQIAILLVGVLASQEGVGAIRATQTLLGPLSILGMACFGFTVPEIARRTHLNARKRLLAGYLVSGGMGVVTILYAGALLLIPDPVGVELFGDTWAGASSVLLPMCVSALFSGLAMGIAGVLYGLGRAELTFRVNMLKAPVILVAIIGGTLLAGAYGAAWGLAISEAFVLPFWYLMFLRAAHHPRQVPGGSPETDPRTPGVTPVTEPAAATPATVAPAPEQMPPASAAQREAARRAMGAEEPVTAAAGAANQASRPSNQERSPSSLSSRD